ncbi:cytochrome P450 2G1-like [Rhinatrema bivittatum]|uniref:cytochrome P450 2G1-like n=1 Tax=Rhinatrema bivittatum TaxID=194408 RepID=UPI001126746D|nr:cytochrome P450 2G1-like [Rhinatrema bivittatum]
MDLAGTGTLILTLCICVIFISAMKTMHTRGKLPLGPTPLPILGNLLQLMTNNLFNSLLKLKEQYGPVFTVYFGSRPVVVLCDYEAVKEALIDHAEEFSGRGEIPILDKNIKGFGVVFSNGERWKQLRRFSLQTLRNFGMGKRSIEERIQEEAQFLVEEFRKTKQLPCDPTFFFGRSVSNVICSVVFGRRFDYEDEKFVSLLSLINESTRTLASVWVQLYNIFPKLLVHLPGAHQRVFAIFNELRNFVLERVKINQMSLDPSCPKDFIDCFLLQMEQERKNQATEFHTENLLITTMNLFFAGTETVSITLRYGCLIFLKYPEVEEKVHEEIDRMIGQNRMPTIDDRRRMPYTDAVIHEIQRYSNIIPMNLPHSVTRDTQFRGHTIPKGTTVYPVLGSVLWDPQLFPNPERFDPGHFLDENGSIKKTEAFLPFSTGKRVCLGENLARMELFLFFTSILQNFSLKSLIDPREIDITPKETGLGNRPHPYQFCLIPR